MDHDFAQLIDAALRTFWQRNPVTATFAGEFEFNGMLPRADAQAEADECRAIEHLARSLSSVAIPDDASARIDARHLDAYCALECSDYARNARYRNPAWYSGEATFGIISLMLAWSGDESAQALGARLRAIPVFLNDGVARLHEAALPQPWVTRAQVEIGALQRLMREALPLHPAGCAVRAADVAAIVDACERFTAAIAVAADADPACGNAHFATLLARVHGLSDTPAELEGQAAAAFDALTEALKTQARELDSAHPWREQIAALAQVAPDAGDIRSTYRYWHERALRDAHELLTPADDYRLTFRALPEWARPVVDDLYFLFYRSPAARDPGSGSTYWISPEHGSPAEVRSAHNTATVKLVHAVHHGSVGHHTQNARARSAGSRFARIAGTDGAAGIALLAGGTMVEGWACYAEDLLAEIPGFYSPAERLQLTYFELRNVASCLADIRFHCGAYSIEEMRAFYCNEVGFAPARVGSETTRNSMFPGSRVMYWCGTRQIRALRTASPLPAKAFHDRLLSFGSAPIAWIASELTG